MKNFARFLVVLALFLAGCKGNVQTAGVKTEKENIRKLDAEFTQALVARDVEKILHFMAADIVEMDPNSATVFGIDSMRKSLTAWAALPNMELDNKSLVDSVIISGDHAIDWGRYITQSKRAGGIAEFTGNWVNVWQRNGGDWKCIFIMTAPDKPMSAYYEPVGNVEVFTALENKWNNAMWKKDADALDSLFAEEYISLSGDGTISGKKEDIGLMTSEKLKILSPGVLSDVSVKLYGDVAMVKGINDIKATLSGKDIGGKIRFVDTFVMRDSRWQCISTYGAKITSR